MKLTLEEIDELCRMGSLAPSGGNVQPWQIVAHPNQLDFRLHPTRSSSFIDVGHFASIFSLGSLIENVCITSDFRGLRHELQINEPGNADKTIATLRYLRRDQPLIDDTLIEEIPRRCTNRRFHEGNGLDGRTIEQLRNTVEATPDTKLITLFDLSDRKRAAKILGNADAIRIKHELLFTQMMNELRWTSEEAKKTCDGVDVNTLELPKSAILFLRLLKQYPKIRKLIPAWCFSKITESSIVQCSHLGCLAVNNTFSNLSLINAGRAIQRIWLQATRLNVSFQPVTALPFMLIRALYFNGQGLSKYETKKIIFLGQELRRIYALPKDRFPLFVFRLSRTPPPSEMALRLDHRKIYQVCG